MAHHIPALLPQIMIPMPKIERPRWRPGAAGLGERGPEGLNAEAEEEVMEAAQSDRETGARQDQRNARSQSRATGAIAGLSSDERVRAVPVEPMRVLDMFL